MKYIFDVKLDDTAGDLGFKPRNAPAHFEPFGGLGVAHDCMEHNFKDDTGSMSYELMAIGCSLWIRRDMPPCQIEFCKNWSNAIVDVKMFMK